MLQPKILPHTLSFKHLIRLYNIEEVYTGNLPRFHLTRTVYHTQYDQTSPSNYSIENIWVKNTQANKNQVTFEQIKPKLKWSLVSELYHPATHPPTVDKLPKAQSQKTTTL